MTWNYRVYKRILDDGSACYGIHEAYYDEHISEPSGYTSRAVSVEGDSVADLSKALGQMIEALSKHMMCSSNAVANGQVRTARRLALTRRKSLSTQFMICGSSKRRG